jgi:translocation and assembly module TamA
MNPTRGSRLWLGVAPYLTTGDDNNAFFAGETNISAYKSLHQEDRIVVAGRVRAGSILGESRAEIPASKRFYAGGGGSIRGYQFKKVGPLDDQNDPIGGRSVIELSAEARFRITERIGLVPFLDGGTVFTNPDFTTEGDDTIRWAAGLGGRYFTVIGPIRLDVAFPINKRDVDDDFQFYVSIGQAF